MLSRGFPGLGGRDANASSTQGVAGAGTIGINAPGTATASGGGILRGSASGSTYAYRPDEATRGPVGDPLERELRESRQKVDSLQGKVMELESMALDLERRLEEQALQCLAAERECVDIDRQWRAKCADISKEVEEWKNKHKREEGKAEALRQHLSRTERELYGILQKKHQILRGSGGAPGSVRPPAPPSSSSSSSSSASALQASLWAAAGYLGNSSGGSSSGRPADEDRAGSGAALGSTPLPLSGTFEDGGEFFQPQNISTRETRDKFMVKSLNEFLGVV